MTADIEEYYDRRAGEYDRVYEKPERQPDIADLSATIVDALSDRRVLELAAGTGFWTQHYADVARSVTATDVNDSTLAVARARRAWPDHVRFEVADAFDLTRIAGHFDAVFAGFLWSHIPLGRLDDLLAQVIERVGSHAIVLLADNNYVHGSNHPIVRTDAEGNTYQQRTLSDGTEWEVLKNFPHRDELQQRLDPHGGQVEVRSLQYFWTALLRT